MVSNELVSEYYKIVREEIKMEKLPNNMGWTGDKTYRDAEVSELLGKTLKSVAISGDADVIMFECTDGHNYKMYHDQDCCESVDIYDIAGNIEDLLGLPLTMAEDVSNKNFNPEKGKYVDSCTWTWYKFATIKGYVTIRWYGESNGYYSEAVDFIELRTPEEK